MVILSNIYFLNSFWIFKHVRRCVYVFFGASRCLSHCFFGPKSVLTGIFRLQNWLKCLFQSSKARLFYIILLKCVPEKVKILVLRGLLNWQFNNKVPSNGFFRREKGMKIGKTGEGLRPFETPTIFWLGVREKRSHFLPFYSLCLYLF